MLEDIIFRMLLGHFVGDYLFQNSYIAFNKGTYKKIGWITCIIHCLIYTFFVCLLMMTFNPIWILFVFLSHFVIDKFSLGELWLILIKGRSLSGLMGIYQANKNIAVNGADLMNGGFTAVIYTVVDNTMHLLLMYLFYRIWF